MASKKTAQAAKTEAPSSVFPIVGVGASAGGVQAFTQLVRRLPADPGIALIFVLHTDKHESALGEVVARVSNLPVRFATDGATIERDHIYLSPPDAEVAVMDGKLRVGKKRAGLSLPIDLLFGTLAENHRSHAIGVVLSGAASDGALGTKAIKAEGGITFAQDDTAQFNSMPRAAIAAGAIDFVMSPDEVARELVSIARHAYMLEPLTGRLDDEQLGEVFSILKAAHDVDFTHYKPSTIERRIRRRMALHRIETLPDYVKLLGDDGSELEQLYGDLLIRVTGFFRDPEVFEALQRNILPALMHGRPEDAPIRVWVPGCATGEEVYSIAVSLSEIIQERGWTCPIQIFGTDVSDAALEAARLGIYSENISTEVSPERLRRYFTKAEGGYRVSKSIRDCCVFARQNLTKDPPFSRLDLISCRNVMIYLGSLLQRKVMAIFHYALRPDGYLLLGSSETIGNFAELFANVDRKYKIYQRKSGKAPRMPVDIVAPIAPIAPVAPVAEEGGANVFREADRVLLSRFSPPGVLINDAMEILQFRGRTSPYLEPAPGAPSFNLMKMAREGLLSELRTAVHTARKKEIPVRRDGVRIENNGSTAVVNIEVLPFVAQSRDRHYLVLFEDATLPADETPEKKKKKTRSEEVDTRQVTRFKRELEATREYLQSIIEEQEAMNEELRSANEEIQSSNEELQSTNEELETAKEELQSTNEELTTLNEELENRAGELAEANNDLLNLLASVDIPIVMLDSGLHIRRFNPGAQRLLHLIPGDVGRLMSDLKMSLMVDDFEQMVLGVIETLEVKELEVQDRSGRWHMLRIRPYRTTENRIEGAVLVLIDIDALKKKSAAESA